MDGYLHVVDLVENPGNTEARDQLDRVKQDLLPLEEGEFFAQQLGTALNVFRR